MDWKRLAFVVVILVAGLFFKKLLILKSVSVEWKYRIPIHITETVGKEYTDVANTTSDANGYHTSIESVVYVLTSKELEKPRQPTQPSPPTTPTSPPAPSESPTQLQEETTPPKTNVSNVTQPAVQAVVLVSPQTMVLIGFLVATMILLYLYYSRRR